MRALLALSLLLAACSGEATPLYGDGEAGAPGAGGSIGLGGALLGGATTGGASGLASGGSETGGSSLGGSSGGALTGGSTSGGAAPAGGASSGGTSTGGALGGTGFGGSTGGAGSACPPRDPISGEWTGDLRCPDGAWCCTPDLAQPCTPGCMCWSVEANEHVSCAPVPNGSGGAAGSGGSGGTPADCEIGYVEGCAQGTEAHVWCADSGTQVGSACRFVATTQREFAGWWNGYCCSLDCTEATLGTSVCPYAE